MFIPMYRRVLSFLKKISKVLIHFTYPSPIMGTSGIRMGELFAWSAEVTVPLTVGRVSDHVPTLIIGCATENCETEKK